MGFLSFLGIGSSGLSPRSIQKIARLASNPFAQPDIRREQMQKLIKDGSDAAIKGLLIRFSVAASQSIADEDEKRDLVQELIRLGDKTLEPLREYLKTQTNLTYAAQALCGILDDQQGLEELLQLFEIYTPEDYRSDEQKKQLILFLNDHFLNNQTINRILAKLEPYLLDHSDDVRSYVLDVFFDELKKQNIQEFSLQAKENLQTLLTDSNTSPRIAKKTAELLSQQQISLSLAFQSALNDAIVHDYTIDKKGYVRKNLSSKKAG